MRPFQRFFPFSVLLLHVDLITACYKTGGQVCSGSRGYWKSETHSALLTRLVKTCRLGQTRTDKIFTLRVAPRHGLKAPFLRLTSLALKSARNSLNAIAFFPWSSLLQSSLQSTCVPTKHRSVQNTRSSKL